MAFLSVASPMESGRDYTFRFNRGGGISPETDEALAQRLQFAYAFLDGVRATRGLFSSAIGFQFTWRGPSGTSVGEAASLMTEILGLPFLDAESGRLRQPYDPFGGGADPNNGGALPSLKTLLFYGVVVAGVGVAVFAAVSAFRLTPQIRSSVKSLKQSVARGVQSVARKVKR